MIDGNQYYVANETSDNYVKLQADVGYLYEQKKDSTVFMIIGGNQTFDPY